MPSIVSSPARLNGLKIESILSALMPRPLSEITMEVLRREVAFSDPIEMTRGRALLLYLIALPIRLLKTW